MTVLRIKPIHLVLPGAMMEPHAVPIRSELCGVTRTHTITPIISIKDGFI